MNVDSVHIKPMIFWDGLPPCALLLTKLVNDFKGDLKIVAVKSIFPFDEVGLELGNDILWIKNADDLWTYREQFLDRNLIIQSGWASKGMIKFDRWFKKKGGKIIVAADNIYIGTLRQWIGAVWFRLTLKNIFDIAFVPGRQSVKFMKFLGMPADRIFTGCYGAYEKIYYPGPNFSKRNDEFLFVGQLIHRKGLDLLLDAFNNYRKQGGKWSLRIVGDGYLSSKCIGDGVIFEKFGKPQDVACKMRHAKCLVLPSREEHWGTVVVEAMACGTPSIVTSQVGSTDDLILNGINGSVIYSLDSQSLGVELHEFSKIDTKRWTSYSKLNCSIANCYNSNTYRLAFWSMVKKLFG